MADLGLNRLAAYCRDKVSGRGNAKCILWHTATAAIKRTASKRWVGHVNVGRPGVLAAIGIEMRRQMPALGPLRPASAPSRTAARPLSALPGGRGIASGDSPVAFACIIFASSIRQLQSRAAVTTRPAALNAHALHARRLLIVLSSHLIRHPIRHSTESHTWASSDQWTPHDHST